MTTFIEENGTEWMARSLCRLHPDKDLWFPDNRIRSAVRSRQLREARRICNMCPVFYNCRERAIRNNEQNGVWAGENLGSATGRRKVVSARQQLPPVGVISRYTSVPRPDPYAEARRTQNGPLTA